MTTAILIALNVIAGLFLVAVVLLQAGKGADMGAAFGGANPAVFGPTGQGNVLQRITAATAVIFMGTSLALAVISARQESVFDGTDEPPPLAAPVVVPGAEEGAATPPTDAAGGAEQAAVEPAASGAVDEGAVPTPTPGGEPAETAPAAAAEATPPPPATPPAAAPEPPPAAAVQ